MRLGSLFGDHMVLQRGVPLPVWGTARPGAEVSVRFRHQRLFTRANAEGRWRVTLDPVEAGGPWEMVVAGDGEARIRDVLGGEVWICSGQSNMEWPLAKSRDGEQEVKKADSPRLRLYAVEKESARVPKAFCGGAWQECTPAAAASFSGVGYFFGRELERRLGVPVGLVQAAWSGAAAESWIPRDVFEGRPEWRSRVRRWEDYERAYAGLAAAYEAARERGDKGASQPKKPDGPEMTLGGLYNGMLHAVIPYAVRGVAWYQGENNVGRPEEYEAVFPLLIREWRGLWGQRALPFVYVQIANFGEVREEPSDSLWARLREAQMSGLREADTAMVPAIDLGEARSLHPANKRDVGLRLARAAGALVYGDRDAAWTGPMKESVEFGDGRIVCRFRHAGKGLRTTDGGPIRGFAVAGPGGRFRWARAEARGEEAVVECPAGTPAAVRYAWASNPAANLCNSEGLPAFPFRTDDWPPERALRVED